MSKPKRERWEDPTYDPEEEGFDDEQEEEVKGWEEGRNRFFRELAEED